MAKCEVLFLLQRVCSAIMYIRHPQYLQEELSDAWVLDSMAATVEGRPPGRPKGSGIRGA